MEFKSGHGS